MKALFVFSSRALKYKDKYYAVSLTPDTLHKLYFPYCDHMVMCLREKKVESMDGLTYAEADDISYHNVEIDSSIDFYVWKRPLLERKIREEVKQADYVIARMGLSGAIAAKYARKYHKPYVCEVVGSVCHTLSHHSVLGKIIAPYMEWMVKKEIAGAEYVMYVTEKSLQKQYPASGKTAGISDVEILDYDRKNLEDRLDKIRYSRKNRILKLATTGPIDKALKGQAYVVRAMARLKKENIIFEYHLIGGGRKNKILKLAKRLGVENQIVFAGIISHEKVFDYLKSMDVYIQPSLAEGLPRSVVEAMSLALPCCGSNVDGIPELLQADMIFKPKDVKGIAAVLRQLDQERLAVNAEYGFQRARRFTEESAGKRRKQFWEAFMNDNFQ